MFDPVQYIIDMFSHVVIVTSFMLTLGFWETIIGISIFIMFCNKFMPVYLSSDNQLHKIGGIIWSPIHSYFYECMRGTSIIRAFGQEKAIMKK